MNKHILYLLVTKDKTSFKVGISSDKKSEYERIKNLHKIYRFDLSISYMIEACSEKVCRTLEKQLHNDYKKYQYIHEEKRDGHTEFLSYECFEDVLIDIKHKQRLEHLGIVINQSIEFPKIIPSIKVSSNKKNVNMSEEDYYDNTSFFKLLDSLKEHLSFVNNHLIVEHDDIRKTFEEIIDFYQDFNKKNNYKNCFRFFKDAVGCYETKTAIIEIFKEYDKDSPQQKKIDDIISYLEKNIKVGDVSILEKFETKRKELVESIYTELELI
jgi:hypothetical protein